ncbi:protein SMALL AUXIN UP-REGULATED RNA 12-like [Andrographis paniculata]|uniref:protein SMALL AUXIN UP-REGULATED RNA 12-like n=1 Tax=Andrographis paniculata TaxID=175694 RepID=UPI0021E7CF00|nr:protein SMALL AUXIN UP-REGULATED RNA 12-like [Andrographis paniculata]
MKNLQIGLGGRKLKACMKKWRRFIIPCATCAVCCKWSLWPLSSKHEEKIVPSDVPKGHLVVYVGECRKRFVIKVSLLKHPLFQALLDQARDVYDFNANTRLCIPCDENIFLSVVQCAKSPPDRRLAVCL